MEDIDLSKLISGSIVQINGRLAAILINNLSFHVISDLNFSKVKLSKSAWSTLLNQSIALKSLTLRKCGISNRRAVKIFEYVIQNQSIKWFDLTGGPQNISLDRK